MGRTNIRCKSLYWPTGESIGIFYTSLEVTLRCVSETGNLVSFLLSAHQSYPIPWTLPILPKEPYSNPRLTPDSNYPLSIGSPPYDIGGA